MHCKDATKPAAAADPFGLLDQQRGGDETVGLARMATVGTLACMLAHEMNNLLTPVLSYAKMAARSPSERIAEPTGSRERRCGCDGLQCHGNLPAGLCGR